MAESDKFWDKKAEGYAKSPVSDEETYQRKLSETQSFFTPDMQVLEFGCGTGTTAVHHAPHVLHIDAIDISDDDPDEGNFEIKCLSCGSTDVEVIDSRGMGSSQTGAWGSLDLYCKCGKTRELRET